MTTTAPFHADLRHNERRRMLTPEDHTMLLRTFSVEHLLTLVEVEAKRFHDSHFTIFAFTTEYKVAFGTPSLYPDRSGGPAHAQVQEMPGFATLKEALIAALVSGKTFQDYFDGAPDSWFGPSSLPHLAAEDIATWQAMQERFRQEDGP